MDMRQTGIVIAGGKSSRMGQNKALIAYKGKRLIDHALETLKPFVDAILISSNETIGNVSYPIVSDSLKGIGPIGGLYSCLIHSKTEVNLVIACDVPHVDPGLYVQIIEKSRHYDAVIPRLPDGKLEPLVACYNKSIVPVIKSAIEKGDYKLLHLFEKINVAYIDVLNVSQFKNINTPDDLL